MIIKKAKFIVSQSDSAKCQDYGCPEIAIAGKSNVGKSSFINMMTHMSKLAKTSSTPGRTRLLNYFDINDSEFIFVDLPGYGYATVGEEEKQNWGKMIEGYLMNNHWLVNVFVLVDIRHTPSVLDKQMVAYLHHFCIPFTIIATKSDKLSRNEIIKQKQVIATEFAVGAGNIIATSASKKVGEEEVCAKIQVLLDSDKATRG